MTLSQQDIAAIQKLRPDLSLDDIKKAMDQELCDCVMDTLTMLETNMPKLNFDHFNNPLIAGSGNAYLAGKILLNGKKALFADESSYPEIFEANQDLIDGVYVLSASGSKHSGELVEFFSQGITKEGDFAPYRLKPTHLVTCTKNSDAEQVLSKKDKGNVVITPNIRELYTYNTSTYLSWLFAVTGEDPRKIKEYIKKHIDPIIPKNIGGYSSYYLTVPNKFDLIRGMYSIKFDELFHPHYLGQVFTQEQTTHAKTIIPSPTQLFITFGEENKRWGKPSQRLNIPLPEDIGYAGMMAIGYYVIGMIQAHKPPLFKDYIVNYCLNELPKSFGKPLSPIIN